MNRMIASMAVLLLFAPVAASAQPMEGPQRKGPGSGEGHHFGLDALMAPGSGIPAQVAEKLGISDEKLKKIRDAAFAANDELITLEASARRAQLQFDRLLAEPAPDEKKALEKLDEVGAAEQAVRRNRVRLLLRVRTVLGPELWQKVQQLPPPFDAGPDSALLSVKLGAELVLSIPNIERVALGDPSIADINAEAGRIRIKGTGRGRTTLLVWVKGAERLSYLIDVRP